VHARFERAIARLPTTSRVFIGRVLLCGSGVRGQLFIAPAAAQAFMSLTAIGSLLGPPGGMVPPNQLKHDPVLAKIEPVPLMYPWPFKYE